MKFTGKEVRAHAKMLRDCRVNTDATRDRQQDKLADICDAYADLLERIKEDEVAVTDEVTERACKAMGQVKGLYPSWPEMRAALLAVWPNPPAQAAQVETWRPMDSAPADGTMLRLLVDFTEHATEDSPDPAPTIGANNFENDGEDRWLFAGWCWEHDHFTQGKGTPVGWLPMITTADPGAQGDDAEARSHARMIHDFPRLSAFFQKHALGSKLPVSCFACGHVGERTITHAELADVYVCKTCAERITTPPAQPAERVPDAWRQALERALPFLDDEAGKYEDDGNNEPLDVADTIRDLLTAAQQADR